MASGEKIAVGLSGGIDSAVAALLLKEAGYDVIGLTMQIWDGGVPIAELGRSGCYGPGEAEDLKSVSLIAERLGIEHYVINLVSEYKQVVLNYFRQEYLAGRTPNPCVRCNQQLKFGFLQQRAREQGIEFDLFATGHYARISFDQQSERFLLRRASYQAKDQSYFLARLKQEQLKRLIFPLGETSKERVREKASSVGWQDLLDRKESQDFIESDSYSVLFDRESIKPGPLLNQAGEVIGQHRGLVYYTVGQRRGLGLTGCDHPNYVTELDGATNTVKIGSDKDLYGSVLLADDLNWIAREDSPVGTCPVQAKIRLAHKPAEAVIEVGANSGEVVIRFKEPQRAITPGQMVVFYQDDLVLGSGIIRQRE